MTPQNTLLPPILEVCVDDAAGIRAAVAGGADRIELCAALACGGLTPTKGLMELAAEVSVPVNVMIRPRSGSFVFSRDDRRLMIADIMAAKSAGLAGVVLGASHPDGRLDVETLRVLRDAAEGMDVTLHRAFDLVPDHMQALEEAESLGFKRILTSGGQKNAFAGLEILKQLVMNAKDRVSIMPGGGVNVDNVNAFAQIGIREFHASCSMPVDVGPALLEFGFELSGRRVTDEQSVRVLKERLSTCLVH